MAMARGSSGLAYPDRFFAAAAYVGFGGSPDSASTGVISKFPNDVALLLYGLYQQATIGPCKVPKPSAWNPVENGKWTSWNGLGNMASTEAMRLFVKLLEEEDPAWYSRIPETVVEPVVEPVVDKEVKVELEVEVEVKPKVDLGRADGDFHPEPDIIPTENGNTLETPGVDVPSGGLGGINIYDQWIAPEVSGQPPKSRYEHGAAVVQEKMYIFGGNHNGRYLSDLQFLDLKSLTWSKIEAKVQTPDSSNTALPVPCAGHSLVPWGSKILSIAGHAKDPSETVTVKEFDPQTCTWSDLKAYGKAPGVPPSPRSDHAAAVHADRYVLIFGGGSHATCFNDLHVLDLQNMEWSKPKQQGIVPSPRAGHAGVTVGENWYIVGGGDNINGVSETLVLNMSTLVWSVVTTVQGRVPLASEGLSLVVSSHMGEDILVSFGGYNGRYSNEVYALKPSHKSGLHPKMLERPESESVGGQLPISNAPRDGEPEFGTDQDRKISEAVADDVNSEHANVRSKATDEQLLATLKADKEELEAALAKEELQRHQLKQELTESEARNVELTKELQSVRGQLAGEQSRCFKLEVDIAELRQKLQTLETLQKELELLRRQKAASEQAALDAKQRQSPGGVWGWLAGPPSDPSA